jgi:ankyrin repeat protein
LADNDINEKDGKGWTPLDYAIRDGHLDMIKWAIENRADPSNPHPEALVIAHESGHRDVINFLLPSLDKLDRVAWTYLYKAAVCKTERNIPHAKLLSQVNQRDYLGRTILYHAANGNDYGFVRWLVNEFNANFNIPGPNGVHPTCMFNSESMDEQFLEWLVKEATLDSAGQRAVLHCVVKRRNRRLIDWLLHEKKIDLNEVDDEMALCLYLTNDKCSGLDSEVLGWLATRESLKYRTFNGCTPLLLYLEFPDAEIDLIKDWVDKKGADINVLKKDGKSALHVAACRGRLEIMQWLIDEKGQDRAAVDQEGWTALHMAVRSLKAVKWLVDVKGVEVGKVNNAGCTVLDIAAYMGHMDVVQWLVEERGADFAGDQQRWTALHKAAYNGHLEIVKWLVEGKGADITVSNKKGENALHFAAYGGQLEIVRWLVEEGGADVTAATDSGQTALHLAENLEIVRWLVERGADAKAVTKDGESPLVSAKRNGRWEVVEWLASM